MGRNDYASNGGDYYTTPGSPVPPAWAYFINDDGGPTDVSQVENPPGQMTAAARTTFANVAHYATGVIFAGSLIKMADVSDGTSCTYLAGEKYLCPDYYTTGQDIGDNEGTYNGDNDDVSRWAASSGTLGSVLQPAQDTPGAVNTVSFGSAHANGFYVAFCDGSVQMMNYSIDPETHRRLGNRKDGQAIDGKKF